MNMESDRLEDVIYRAWYPADPGSVEPEYRAADAVRAHIAKVFDAEKEKWAADGFVTWVPVDHAIDRLRAALGVPE